MVRVIVNADDIGLSPGVTRGITRAMTAGIATSATFMATMPDAEGAASRIVADGLDVGVHLNITQGRPLMPARAVSSLLDEGGEFLGHARLHARLRQRAVSLAEIEAEFGRQIERTRELGIEPTHLDTHHHMHSSLGVARALHRVARDHAVPKLRTVRSYRTLDDELVARLGAADRRRRSARGRAASRSGRRDLRMPIALLKPETRLDDWIGLFDRLRTFSGEGAFEIICHPAEPDDELRRLSTFVESRELELMLVTAPELIAAVSDPRIELISFRDL